MTTAEVQQAFPVPRSSEIDIDRDRELVFRSQSGDKSAFDELYACYFSRLEKYCFRRLADPFEAQDIAQESFLRAWRALPRFAGDRRFYPWLSVIASNLCTDAIRRRRRFGPVPVAEPWERDVATGSATEDSVVASVEIDLAAKAYSQLSDRHKRVLDLRERSGMTYQEIADKEGIRITTVETLIWRARNAFKREYSALVDSDDRLAAIIGAGALQAGLLKRVLRFAGKTSGKLVGAGPGAAATAVGSAVAATALVIAATSPAPHEQHNALPVVVATHSERPLPAMSPTTASRSRGQKIEMSARAGQRAAQASITTPQTSGQSTPPVPSTQGHTVAIGSSRAPTGLVRSTVGPTNLTPPPTTKQIVKKTEGVPGSLPATVKSVVKQLEGTVSSTLSEVEKKVGIPLGSIVGSGVQLIGGLSGTVGSASSTTSVLPGVKNLPSQAPASPAPAKTEVKSDPPPVGLLQKLLG
jgi:RNA polymerase sigma-70 factor, ECF subfamily